MLNLAEKGAAAPLEHPYVETLPVERQDPDIPRRPAALRANSSQTSGLSAYGRYLYLLPSVVRLPPCLRDFTQPRLPARENPSLRERAGLRASPGERPAKSPEQGPPGPEAHGIAGDP